MNKIKDAVAVALYATIVFFVKLLPARAGTGKHLLLVKTDEIGDFILFRSFFKTIKNSERYKDYKVTLVGNAAWKPIFERYDQGEVTDVLWINKKQFNNNLSYRFNLLKQVRQLGVSDVVNCIYSRSFTLDDGIAFVATGREKIAMLGNNANRGKFGLNVDSVIYTQIIDAGNERLFETVRNSNYIKKLLHSKAQPVSISLPFVCNFDSPAEAYFLLFIGAGNKPDRRWPLKNFAECAHYISSKYQLTPIVCGGPGDEQYARQFMNIYTGPAIDLAGKTKLTEFIDLAAKARLLLSVDTGPVHMAAAAGCPVVALFSGVYYKRYAPYPREVSPRFYSFYADFVDEMIAQDDHRLYNPFKMENSNIRKIQPEKLYAAFDLILKK